MKNNNKVKSNNKVVKSFSEMTISEQIKKLEHRNLNLLKEMRNEICIEDKVPYRNTIVENWSLIAVKASMIH